MAKQKLTIDALKKEAAKYVAIESLHDEESIYGVTDGKAIGTYVEHKFKKFLLENYEFDEGSSSKGKDFPGLDVDMKTTSDRQPQSSCPFKSARQKIYGLGYGLLVFVYDKTDDDEKETGRLNFVSTIFVDASHTGDYQTTTGLRKIVENKGNVDDILAFFQERLLPVDEIQAEVLANQVLNAPPEIGYLTISNALQWRLSYRRAIDEAPEADGVHKLR